MEILNKCLPDSIRTLTQPRPDGSVDAQTYVFDFTAPTSVEGDEIHLSSKNIEGSALSEVYIAGTFHIGFTYDDVKQTIVHVLAIHPTPYALSLVNKDTVLILCVDFRTRFFGNAYVYFFKFNIIEHQNLATARVAATYHFVAYFRYL